MAGKPQRKAAPKAAPAVREFPGPVVWSRPADLTAFERAIRNPWFLAILMALVTLVVYIPAMTGGLIWDDDVLLTTNPFIFLPGLDGLKHIWDITQRETPDYFPLTSTFFWVEYKYFGMPNTMGTAFPGIAAFFSRFREIVCGYHVTTILLHVINSLLLWRLLKYLKMPGAWLAAAVFALHPVNVMSVAWISEKKNTMSLLFLLLTLMAWFKYEDTDEKGREGKWGRLGLLFTLGVCAAVLGWITWLLFKITQGTGGAWELAWLAVPPLLTLVLVGALVWPILKPGENAPVKYGWLAASVALFLAALLAKSTVVVLAPIMLLFCWWRRDRLTWRDAAATAPFFLLALFLGYVTLKFQYRPSGGMPDAMKEPLRCALTGLALSGRAVTFYLRHILLPDTLSAVYPRWDFIDPTVAMMVDMIRGRIAYDGAAMRQAAFLLFPGTVLWLAGGFLLLPLLVMKPGTLSRTITAAVAYALMTLTLLFEGNPENWTKALFWQEHWLLVLGVAMVWLGAGCLFVLKATTEWIRNLVFVLVFFVITLGPLLGFFPAMFMQFSFVADHWLYISLPIIVIFAVSTVSLIWNSLPSGLRGAGPILATLLLAGFSFMTWMQAEVFQNHETLWKSVKEKNPSAWVSWNNYGSILAGRGDLEEAAMHFKQAMVLNPGYADACHNLATTLAGMGKRDEAISVYAQAIRMRPDARSWTCYGMLLEQKGMRAEALAALREAVKADKYNTDSRFRLAQLLDSMGQVEEAIEHYRASIYYRADKPESFNNLAWYLATLPDPRLRNPVEALTFSQHAVTLTQGRDPNCLDTLGVAFAANGDFPHAIEAAQKALTLFPPPGTNPAADAQRAEIDRRIGLYNQGKPIVDNRPQVVNGLNRPPAPSPVPVPVP